MWLMHVLSFSIFFLTWVMYEIAFAIWQADPNSKTDAGGTKLRILAFTELFYNISSVFLGLLLFRVINKITSKD